MIRKRLQLPRYCKATKISTCNHSLSGNSKYRLLISWLERASAYQMPRGFEPNIEDRKLSTIYQFVRGMPVLYVETHLGKELEDIKVAESQLEGEELQEEFRQRKAIIMRKLGQRTTESR